MITFSEQIRLPPADGEVLTVKGRFRVEKSDDEKHLAFGWASVAVNAAGDQVEDYQHDLVDIDVLEQAAYRFVEFYREGGEMHERGGAAILVESMVFTAEKQRALGIPPGTIPEGWWIGFHVTDPDVWERVKDGTYPMFSIEGEAVRVDVSEGGGE